MIEKPTLAIVGRPNVGKSALFNRICGKRLSIVDAKEGVTRDRLYAYAENFGFSFRVIDTGGVDQGSTDEFQHEIAKQALIAVEEADAIIMVVDGRVGPTILDHQLANILLRSKKPVCLAVNKIDDLDQEVLMHEFYGLGISKMLPISAMHGVHIPELIQEAWKGVKVSKRNIALPKSTRISFVGRPNVGKSTLVNALLEDERCIVSTIPGTTRDSIDIPFKYNEKSYLLVDTAGIRRKKSEKDAVDKFAALRTESAIENSDICVLVIDVQDGFTAQEKKIACQIEAAGKGCILLLNKWDLVAGFRMEHCLKAIQDENPFLAHCPVLIVSGKTGRNIDQLFPEIEAVQQAYLQKVTTAHLNKYLERALQLNHPPMIKGKRLRIYYMTQIKTAPPSFVLFVNIPELLTENYKRYLIKQFRSHFLFQGVPLHFELRGKEKSDREFYQPPLRH